jgi:CO/xanthine dehydrogenase FAD-binding subunit
VKSPPFRYHAPGTLDEAVELLASEEGARPLAGGQSLVPLLKLRLTRPGALVDLNGVAGLDGVEQVDGGELRVGALTRQQTLLEDDGLARSHPLIREAVRFVGYRATRHRGTLGGSLAYAAPWAELPAVTVALDATIDVRSAGGTRSVPAREFFHDAYTTALRPGELITGVRFPAAKAGTGVGFHEVSARFRDYAQVAAAAVVTLAADGTCSGAELVLVRVAGAPYRAEIGELVRGTRLDDATLDAVGERLRSLDPPDDVHVSGAYRRRVAPVLARRALASAFVRAGQGEAA